MTKEDYMRLPKERLAELLVERDNLPTIRETQRVPFLQCYEPNGICTNPFRDCINCPKQFEGGNYTTTTNKVEEQQ